MIEQKKDIPPGLIRIVKEKKPFKKLFLLLGFALFLVFVGVGIVYFYGQYLPLILKDRLNRKEEISYNTPQIISQKETSNLNESNKEDTAQDIRSKDMKTDIKKYHKQTETVKIAKEIKTENETTPKQLPLFLIDSFKGADCLYRAQDYELKGMLLEAINEYKEYINYSGKAEPKILNKIAILYLLIGNLKEANHYAELTIRNENNSREILINYGVIKAKIGEFDKAEESFNKALTIDPNDKTALFNLALLKEKKGQYKEALSLYEKLHQLGDASVVTSIERLKAYK